MRSKTVDNINKEVGVFKIKQQTKVHQNTAKQQAFLVSFISYFVNSMAYVIIKNSGNQNKTNIPAAGFIKKIKGKHSKQINPQGIELIANHIYQQKKTEEKQEKRTVEQQRVLRVIKQYVP
jgi:hypothetical protein